MGIIIIILTGAALGWIATIIEREDGARSVVRHMMVGVAGALAAAVIVRPLVADGLPSGTYSSAGALLLGALGAVIALLIANLVAREVLR